MKNNITSLRAKCGNLNLELDCFVALLLAMTILILISSNALAAAPKSGPAEVENKRTAMPKITPPPVYTPPGRIKIEPPKDWIADNQSGTSQGVAMVFYPKDGSWQKSPSVLYLRTSDRIDGSVQKIIDADIASYQDINPRVKVTDEKGLFTADNALAIVKKLSDDASKNMELIAYILQDETISIITLNARNEKEAKKAYPAFKALVNSYAFIDEDRDAFTNEDEDIVEADKGAEKK